MIKTEELSLARIVADPRCQPREAASFTLSSEYANEMREGAVFPPVVVFHDGEHYWLADGFHRIEAAKAAKRATFPARVHQGSVRDAILYSCSANTTHGLKRSNSDKRNAVLKLLKDEVWSGWSDNRIAVKCQVSYDLVATVRASLTSGNGSDDRTRTYETRHGTVATMDTANIGPRGPRRPAPTWANEVEPTEEEIAANRFEMVRLYISKIARLSEVPVAELLAGAKPDELIGFKLVCAEARANLLAIERKLT